MKKYVWTSLLDADLNARYWKELAGRYSQREKYLKIFLAVMTSGTVASWGIWADIPHLWKTLSAISAIVSITLPILDYPKQIEAMARLGGKWSELRIKYEGRWRELKDITDKAKFEEKIKIYKLEQIKLEQLEPTLPNDYKLLKKCQNDVLTSRGFKKEGEKNG